MIDIHDLCVGNWVYDGEKTQFPMFIRAIGEDYVYLDFDGNEGNLRESTPEELQGIPLTEELLTKLGFVFNGTGLWKKTEKKREVSINIEREFLCVEAFDFRWFDSRGWWHGVKFLHQLQNFFRNMAREDFAVEI
jgi:hypothetical protein